MHNIYHLNHDKNPSRPLVVRKLHDGLSFKDNDDTLTNLFSHFLLPMESTTFHLLPHCWLAIALGEDRTQFTTMRLKNGKINKTNHTL